MAPIRKLTRGANVKVLRQLRLYESQNITFTENDDSWPIVWKRARGMHVWDMAGERYLDLTAAFGVAAAGHANPAVVKAGVEQMRTLCHAMGDVHPHAQKAALAARLSSLTFERWTKEGQTKSRGKSIFANSGFEAVEAALKTALLLTGKSGVIAFTGSYHGLGYGSLTTTHRLYFRSPFRTQLAGFASFIPFPKEDADLELVEHKITRLCRRQAVGAILVEPIQGRGGLNVPPNGLLPLLRDLSREHGCLLVLDEIFTGFGRTGNWFACEHSRTVPDLICLGKALTGGFPLSACVGEAGLMDEAWPKSEGEALHTSTFSGHPVGSAMALAQISVIERENLCLKAMKQGEKLRQKLAALQMPRGYQGTVRGVGLMTGLELKSRTGEPASEAAFAIIKEMLRRRFLLLTEGVEGNVIAFTPPLIITDGQIIKAAEALQETLKAVLTQ